MGHPARWRVTLIGHFTTGAITSVLVRPGRLLRINGAGSGLGMSTDSNPAPVDVVLSVGARVFSSSFGGETTYRAGRDYRARNAPAPRTPPL